MVAEFVLQHIPFVAKKEKEAWDGWYWGYPDGDETQYPTFLFAPEPMRKHPTKIPGFISFNRPEQPPLYNSLTSQAIMTQSTDLGLWNIAREEKGENFHNHLNSMLMLNAFSGDATARLVEALLDRIAELETE